MTLRVLDLFSGIGGFSLGLERTGCFETAAFCEIDPFCRAVLAEHWPGVPCFEDIRSVGREQIAGLGPIDVICGGFPCQDISVAGKGAGLDGADSGLWREYDRVIDLARPTWVVIENSPRLRTLGADRVLADLEARGYAGWPLVVGALHAGSPQERKRVWIVAHAEGDGRGEGRPRRLAPIPARLRDDALFAPRGGSAGRGDDQAGPWARGPLDGGHLDDGLPEDVVAGLRAIGNAALPQITEIIGRTIVAAETGVWPFHAPNQEATHAE